eukprot:2518258-Amphidinium_carterae.1
MERVRSFVANFEGVSDEVPAAATRHAAGIEDLQYKEIADYVATVKPTMTATEHFAIEVPKAFPEILPHFVRYYIEKGSVIASNRIDEG